MLRGAPRLVRIGGPCQNGFGVPAVPISMLLLDGSVGDALAAIALHRPDLLNDQSWLVAICDFRPATQAFKGATLEHLRTWSNALPLMLRPSRQCHRRPLLGRKLLRRARNEYRHA